MTNGAVVYEGKFLHSFHLHDPAGGRSLNAFDLMRVQRFGNLGEEESMRQALRYAAGIPEVQAKLEEMRAAEAAAEFTKPDQPPPAGMPEPILLSDILTPPQKPPELISGILRRGHKMLIAGPSKAGKSFLLIELAICIAEGLPWLGFQCAQGKVLYVNLEIDPASCIDRFLQIYKCYGLVDRHTNNIILWNLRGHALPLDRLVPILISHVRNSYLTHCIK
jgi:hypothetical protein